MYYIDGIRWIIMQYTVVYVQVQTFTFMHLADAFIQSKLQYSAFKLVVIISMCVFPGYWTHNIYLAKHACT